MKFKILVTILLLLPIFVFSQNKQNKIKFKGRITDAKTKQAISFAYVKLKDLAIGTVTNPQGYFQIAIPSKYKDNVIIFSYLGYKTEEIKLSSIKNKENFRLALEIDTKILSEVIITPEKPLNAKALLRKVISKIPDNYPTEAFHMKGYYRETVKENGAYIKYADAFNEYNYQGYGQKYKKKDYQSALNWKELSNNLSNSFSLFPGYRMHRYHFGRETLKTDQVKISEARASNNLSKTRFSANIEGASLGILGKDRVKFNKHFLNPKKFDRFVYEVGEVEKENGDWQYMISFKPKMRISKLENIANSRNKSKRYSYSFYANRTMKGKIYINQDDFAITTIEYAIPPKYKKYICSFEGENIQHFGYKIRLDYEKSGDKYFIKHIKQEDEFITIDTAANETTPYAAVSELFIQSYQTDNKSIFGKEEILPNVDMSQLFEYPQTINQDFWKQYQEQFDYVKIPQSIRKDMEAKETLENQFVNKLKRNENLAPPLANKKEYSFILHGEKITDNYHWLKDTSKRVFHNEEVMSYLDEENAYVENYFRPLKRLQKTLFNEMVAQTEENFESLPTRENGYLYYHRFKKDWEYPIYYRKNSKTGKEEVLLNVAKLAKGKPYYAAGVNDVSPNNQIMSFYENTTGSDEYILKFKDLKKSKVLLDSIQHIGGMVWIDNHSFFYVEKENKTLRNYQLKKHILGTNQSSDLVIYTEEDKTFGIGLQKSKSKKYFFLNVGSKSANEIYYYQVAEPEKGFVKMYPRKEGHNYLVKHFEDYFYILTNQNAINRKIIKVKTSDIAIKNWEEVIAHKEKILITGFEVFKNYLVIGQKEEALNRIKIVNKKTEKSHAIKMKQNISSVYLGYNPDFDTDTLQFNHASLRFPSKVYNYNMETHKKRLVKSSPKLGYGAKVKRIWAEARDGEKIPMTLFYNKFRTKKLADSTRKVYMTSYGAYGTGMNIAFDPTIPVLLNRNFVYAIAHVRGGDDLGMKWHQDGKMLNKMNTFTDFIDCAEYLIAEGYVEKGNIVAQGASAGGLLMGAVANMRPDLFKAIILDVPFVDVINTMLDDKLPLTTGEYKEWGNPNEKKYYDYIKKYSPYENVKKQNYPHLIFTTSLNDTRVAYWEPAKMVAKLRENKTDNNYIFLKTQYHGGHGGGSGRYTQFRDLAYKWAIIFDLFERKKKVELN